MEREMNRKRIAVLLVIAMLVIILPLSMRKSADADEIDYGLKDLGSTVKMSEFDQGSIVHSGMDGSISWAIDGNGCLKIEGNGDWEGMDSGKLDLPEWLDYADEIITAKVNVTGISNCNDMFYGCRNLLYIDMQDFNTSKVSDMSGMFMYCSRLQKLDLSGFDTSKVEKMDGMFESCSMLQELDLSNFDTKNVESMMYMFQYCESLENINITSFETSKLQYMNYMFEGCKSLKKLDLSSFDLSNLVKSGNDGSFSGFYGSLNSLSEIKAPRNLSSYFKYNRESDSDNDSRLPYRTTSWTDEEGNIYKEFPYDADKSIDLSCDSASLESVPMSGTFGQMEWSINNQGQLNIQGVGECKEKWEKYPQWHEAKIYIKSCVVDVAGITDSSYMFADLPYLEEIEFKYFDTSNVTNMRFMFEGDVSLKSLDVSGFDTSNVTTMSGMFRDCISLSELNLVYFQTKNVGDFWEMFSNCCNLKKIDLRNFDMTDSDIIEIFEHCSSLKQMQLPAAKNISSLQGIFKCCHNLTNLDISNWNLESVPLSEYEDSWTSFLGGAVSLSQIKAPVNLKVEVTLPEGNWTDENGNNYTNLPMNQSESILLRNSEKQQYEWEDLDPLPTLRPVLTESSVNHTGNSSETSAPAIVPESSPVVPDIEDKPEASEKPSAVPGKVVIKSAKKQKGRKLEVKWKKVKEAIGYQVAYSTDKKFRKKRTKIKNIKKTTVILANLKKKDYYIKVRAYRLDGAKKVYGKWGKVKKIKIKK